MASIVLGERNRQALRVRGRVQGVGFRPFVYRLATDLGLDGWVRNDGEGVLIALAGDEGQLARFGARLAAEAPVLARVDSVEPLPTERLSIAAGFRIEASGAGPVTTGITPDAATCSACLEELFDPVDRRWRYPFTNCTHCGPRFTITAGLPYDRPMTSMARFALCPACRREYEDPRDRRFHAQPNACPLCGPRLSLADASGNELAVDDVIAEALARIAAGGIVAIKGLGGFHLVCDARNGEAVARLRARKHRDEKPFAVMVANADSARSFARVDAAAAALLAAVERPIVLLPKGEDCDGALPGVAPGLAEIGLMLPYTPIQYLLFHEAAGRPRGTDWLGQPQPLALVMTSANPGGEPLVIGNDEAVARLGAIADAFVLHDRDILVRCDDSVVRPRPASANGSAGAGRSPGFVRRARGYTPAPIELAHRAPAVLATGAYLKNAACLTRGSQAFLSPHIGDLDNAASRMALEEAVVHLQRVLAIRPEAIAHDLHPDFFSTVLARRLADELGVPAIGVQHHHAHIAALAAEHRVETPLLGVALDGVGLGEHDEAWGGELLRLDGARFTRLGHLRELPLPGGDRAAREPWRMAAAVLHLCGWGEEIGSRFASQPAAPAVAEMLARDLNCPRTSSAGRWFDAAAGLLGVSQVMNYEGQAAMQLEALAARHRGAVLEGGLWRLDGGVLDLLPLLQQLADERDAAAGAALFHATLAAALAEWIALAARRQQLTTVALGGGCLLNRLLTAQLGALLRARGLAVLTAEQAPPNDGGIALGQAWVAQRQLQGED
ncbi:MAG: carbamoyltransferase HypF [Burkholderiales bacterium]|nr:carbamoyltransferase HypF [Burkholderiales bacterium]